MIKAKESLRKTADVTRTMGQATFAAGTTTFILGAMRVAAWESAGMDVTSALTIASKSTLFMLGVTIALWVMNKAARVAIEELDKRM